MDQFATSKEICVIDKKAIADRCAYPDLVRSISALLSISGEQPDRISHELEHEKKLLIMPSSVIGHYFGVKLASVFDQNRQQGQPTIQGVYCLFSSHTGQALACLDAAELTSRRTAATSALASGFLSRSDSSVLCIAGAGKLARYFIEAHASVRPINRVIVWHRNASVDPELVHCFAGQGISVVASSDLDSAVRQADIVTCLTPSQFPFLKGELLRGGQHVDLVGAHTLRMMEADAECFRRSRVYVDSRKAALLEAGDLVAAIEQGAMNSGQIAGELSDLVTGRTTGRRSVDEITLFKSVGLAVEDLAAATLAYEKSGRPS